MAFVTLAIVEYSGGTLYLADRFYCSWNADSPANKLFVDRITSCEYERAVTYSWWQRTQPSAAIKYMDLNNQDQFFDSIIDGDWKGTRVTLYRVEEKAAFSTAVQVGTFFVRGVSTPDQSTFRIDGESYLDLLDRTVNEAYSSSVTNPQLRSQQKPVTLGNCRWIVPSNHRLNEPAGSVRGAYDVAGGPFEGIVEVRYRGAAVIQSLTRFVTGTQYFPVQDEAEAYGFLYGVQDYKLAAQVIGELRLDANLVGNSDFAAGSGGYPDGWNVDETDGTVAWTSGVVTITGGGSDTCFISQVLTLTVDALYYVTANIDSLTGVLRIFEVGGATLAEIDSSPGPFSFTFSATANAEIAVGFVAGSAGTVTLVGFTVQPANRINNLSEVATFVANRCALGTSELDYVSFATVESAAGHPALAYHDQDDVNGKKLLVDAADAYSASVYQDRFGVLRAVRAFDPSTRTEDYTIYIEDIDGSIEREVDDAPSLTTKLRYNENYAVHTDDDMAGLPASVAGAPAIRAELSRQYSTVESSSTPHSSYTEAVSREARVVLLQDSADAQAKADYDVDLFSTQRSFWTCVVRRVEDAELYEIEPGDVIKVYGSRYGLSAGRKLAVIYAKNDFVGEKLELSLWG